MMAGRKATAEEAMRANAAAHALVQKIVDMNLPEATEYVRQHPQSHETVANLAFYAHELLTALTKARKRRKGTKESIKVRREAASLKEAKIFALLDEGVVRTDLICKKTGEKPDYVRTKKRLYKKINAS